MKLLRLDGTNTLTRIILLSLGGRNVEEGVSVLVLGLRLEVARNRMDRRGGHALLRVRGVHRLEVRRGAGSHMDARRNRLALGPGGSLILILSVGNARLHNVVLATVSTSLPTELGAAGLQVAEAVRGRIRPVVLLLRQLRVHCAVIRLTHLLVLEVAEVGHLFRGHPLGGLLHHRVLRSA